MTDLTGMDGTIVASYDQDAFGNVLEGSADGYHLTTKQFDSDIGLYYFGARWYDPELGRFTQKDPALTGFYLISGHTLGISHKRACFKSKINLFSQSIK